MTQGRVRWLLIFWMFAISAIAYLDRVNISIAGSSIQEEFGFDDIQLGWVFSAFLVGYALCQAPGGRMADRYGPRVVLTFAVVWWAVLTSLAAMVPAGIPGALLVFLVARFALGVGEAVVFPASNRLVAGWIPSQERGLANGIIFAGVGAGAGVAPPLIAYIMANHGWRWSFWICALIGLVFGLVWHLIARNRPEEHPWVKPGELAHIRSGLPESAATTKEVVPWRLILRNRDIRALTVSYSCFGYSVYIFFTWFFIYLNRERGLDLRASSFYGMLPFLAMATCSPLGGWISDRLSERYGKRVGRCGVAAASMALSAIFMALGMLTSNAQLASVVLAGGAGALMLSTSAFWSATADIAGRAAGSASGVMNTGNQIAGAVTASLTPLLANEFGWATSFLAAAGLCLLGGVAWFWVDPNRRLAAEASL